MTNSTWYLPESMTDNNKRTVCHLAIPIEKSTAYSGTGRLEGDSDFPQSRRIEDSQV